MVIWVPLRSKPLGKAERGGCIIVTMSGRRPVGGTWAVGETPRMSRVDNGHN